MFIEIPPTVYECFDCGTKTTETHMHGNYLKGSESVKCPKCGREIVLRSWDLMASDGTSYTADNKPVKF
jgi:DNA-directed RNA polymerase subunit RPC12/RpoP